MDKAQRTEELMRGEQMEVVVVERAPNGIWHARGYRYKGDRYALMVGRGGKYTDAVQNMKRSERKAVQA